MTEFYSRNHTSMKKNSSKYWQRDDPEKELESKVTKKKFFLSERKLSLIKKAQCHIWVEIVYNSEKIIYAISIY